MKKTNKDYAEYSRYLKSAERLGKGALTMDEWLKLPRKNPDAVGLGRLGGLKGGKSTSPAKQKSSAENGKKGGRPPKSDTA